MKTHRNVRRTVGALLGITVLVASGAVALARTAPGASHATAGNGPNPYATGTPPTVVVDYSKNGTFQQTNTSGLSGFDLGWKSTGCAGKWLAKPVVVLPEANGTINSAPIPLHCDAKAKPNARRAAAQPRIPVDLSCWFDGSGWNCQITYTVGPNTALGAKIKLPLNTTGIHLYLFGGPTFKHEAWVSSTGKIAPETTAPHIPAGANQAFIHLNTVI